MLFSKKDKEPLTEDEKADIKVLRLVFFVFIPVTGITLGLIMGLLLR